MPERALRTILSYRDAGRDRRRFDRVGRLDPRSGEEPRTRARSRL